MRVDTLAELFHASPEPPIERVALAIASDLKPRLDPRPTLEALDEMGAALGRLVARAERTAAHAEMLSGYLYDEVGFKGEGADYRDPRCSDLSEVVARKTGLPITLAVVLMAVGRRAGLRVEGVSFPGHFLVRLGGPEGLYLDPFDDARVLDRADLEALGRRVLGPGGTLHPEHLSPVGSRAIAARMLANLKNLFERRSDHARALVACDRLVDLTASPEVIRDRGVHALALGALGVARDDLARYLRERPDAPDASTIESALRRASTAASSLQ